MSFVHLHNHSAYSLLDGLSNVKKLVARAKEFGMPALALTDHGALYGAIAFHRACKAEEVHPVIGIESYMAMRGMTDREAKLDSRRFHLLLLAENQTGYQNLLKIATASQLDGFYYRPRVDHDFLAAHAEGLICSTGCLASEIPQALMDGRTDDAHKLLDYYYQVFGPDNFFFELQDHEIPELNEVNKQLIDLAGRYDAQFIATNDTHYVRREDARLHDVLLCIQTNSLVSDRKRMRMNNDSYYLRSADEMAALFGNVPGALENTLLIAERCDVNLDFDGYRLPNFDVPEGFEPVSYLRHLCEQGLYEKYGERADEHDVRERLDYELGIINQMGFDSYFLIVHDLCDFAKQRSIWYNARGSAAGSIVAYTLDITMVEPLEHGLIFERFLNPDRISMPDIDLDFQDDRRHELLSYTAEKYGEDRVAQIITFGALKARAAIRDVGRVLDIPLNEVDRVAKLIPAIPGNSVTITEALQDSPDFKLVYDSEDHLREMIDTAAQLEGAFRNAGTHAAGVIIADRPLVEYIPLHRPTGNADTSVIKSTTQFEMEILDSLGLLKVDFLGLRTLTVMARACEFIKARHQIELDINTIPTDDLETYELLGRGDVAGVFQVEGAGMRRFIMQMKPKHLEHVIAMVALFRPGPMDFIPTYIRRMHGEEDIEFLHPSLEPIFKETYGIPVYQEQLMRAAVDLAGYTNSESDDLRKAIAKKIKEKLMKHREKFVAGAANNGIPAETARTIFAEWEKFARYGFNKAHAADYGIIAVQTAYLKTHYPVEYMTALLTAEKNDTTRIALYVADARRMGIDVRPPSINQSLLDFGIEDDADGSSAIRFGMGAVKNVGSGPVAEILRGRAGTHFADLNDFCSRVDLRKVGKRALESLIRVGSLEQLGPRNQFLAAIDQLVSISTSTHKAAEVGQLTMFEAMGNAAESSIELPTGVPELEARELRLWEKELVGVYVSDHPLMAHIDEIREAITAYSSDLGDAHHDEVVTLAGTIEHIRPHVTKKGKSMAFVTLEDLQGQIDLLVFPRTWAEVKDWLTQDQLVIVTGKVDAANGQAKLLVNNISRELKFNRPVGQKTDYEPEPVPPLQTDVINQPVVDIRGEAQPSEDIWSVFDDGDWGQEQTEAAATKPPAERTTTSIEKPTVLEEIQTSTETQSPSTDGKPVEQGPGGGPPVLDEEQAAELKRDGPPVRITVTIRPDSSLFDRYQLRVKWAWRIFTSFPGNDRFSIIVYENGGSRFELDFPNITTGYCDELLAQLTNVINVPNDIDVQPLLL